MKDNKRTYTASFTFRPDGKLEEYLSESEKEYESECRKVKERFEETFENFYKANEDVLSQGDQEYVKWLRDTMHTTFMFAAINGWNLCNTYHTENK